MKNLNLFDPKKQMIKGTDTSIGNNPARVGGATKTGGVQAPKQYNFFTNSRGLYDMDYDAKTSNYKVDDSTNPLKEVTAKIKEYKQTSDPNNKESIKQEIQKIAQANQDNPTIQKMCAVLK